MSDTANTQRIIFSRISPPELHCPTLSNPPSPAPSSAPSFAPYGNCQRLQTPPPTPALRPFSSILYGGPLESRQIYHKNQKNPTVQFSHQPQIPIYQYQQFFQQQNPRQFFYPRQNPQFFQQQNPQFFYPRQNLSAKQAISLQKYPKMPNYSQNKVPQIHIKQNTLPTHGKRQQTVCMETCTPFLNKSVLKKFHNNPWKEDKIFEVYESNGKIRYEVRDANGKELYRFYEDKKANQEGGKVFNLRRFLKIFKSKPVKTTKPTKPTKPTKTTKTTKPTKPVKTTKPTKTTKHTKKAPSKTKI
jgi:hypothetical protein